MEVEQKQEELIDYFARQAAGLRGCAAAPSSAASSRPPATPPSSPSPRSSASPHSPQALKLKQLTVLTLAEANKILPYDQLMKELDILNVRELEDFLISECMYAGIVRGKLDQLRRCFQAQFAAERDLRPGQLNGMIQTLSNWLSVSDNILVSIQDKIKRADSMGEAAKKHQKELEDKIDEVKNSLKTWTPEVMMGSTLDLGEMDYEEERVRPKRRWHPPSCIGWRIIQILGSHCWQFWESSLR